MEGCVRVRPDEDYAQSANVLFHFMTKIELPGRYFAKTCFSAPILHGKFGVFKYGNWRDAVSGSSRTAKMFL